MHVLNKVSGSRNAFGDEHVLGESHPDDQVCDIDCEIEDPLTEKHARVGRNEWEGPHNRAYESVFCVCVSFSGGFLDGWNDEPSDREYAK